MGLFNVTLGSLLSWFFLNNVQVYPRLVPKNKTIPALVPLSELAFPYNKTDDLTTLVASKAKLEVEEMEPNWFKGLYFHQ